MLSVTYCNMSAPDDEGLVRAQMNIFEPVVARVFITRADDSGVLVANHTAIAFPNGTKLEWAMLSSIPIGHYKVSLSNFQTRHPIYVQVNGKTSDFTWLNGKPRITYVCGREDKICNNYQTEQIYYCSSSRWGSRQSDCITKDKWFVTRITTGSTLILISEGI